VAGHAAGHVTVDAPAAANDRRRSFHRENEQWREAVFRDEIAAAMRLASRGVGSLPRQRVPDSMSTISKAMILGLMDLHSESA